MILGGTKARTSVRLVRAVWTLTARRKNCGKEKGRCTHTGKKEKMRAI